MSVKLLGYRHLQYFLMFLAVLVDYAIRTSMSVAIIAMMEANPQNQNIPTYPEWSQKGVILSSFFWGYAIPQIAAGQLTKYISPKWLLAVTMFINSLFTMLVPISANFGGEAGVITCRALQGFTQGFLFPSLHCLIGKWAPSSERSRAVSFVYTAGPLGNVIAMPLSGLIIGSSFGWPAIFYVYGGIGVAWVILWICLAADSPALHRNISEAEKEFILGQAMTSKQVPTPWKSILTSAPFYAIFVAHIGHSWGFWTLLTEIPSYMDKIMKYNISDNSLLSALPYLVLWILGLIFSPTADFLITKRYMTILNVRRLFNSIGLIIPAVCLLWLSFVDSTQRTLAVTLLVLAVGFNSAVYSGFTVNHIDIAPNHAGVLFGITNGLSTISSIVAPLLLDILDYKETDLILWQHIFGIAAIIYLVCSAHFLLFASGEVQSWNDVDNSKETANGKVDEKHIN